MEEMRNENIEEVEGFDFEEEQVETKKSAIDKIKDFGTGAFDKLKKTGEWIKENPEEAAEKAVSIAAAAGIGILTIAGIKSAKKLDRMDYSSDIDEAIELKRKLKNKDLVELDYRVKTGQTKIEALNDMDLIK